MQPDRAPSSALKLSRGLFGAPGRERPANDTEPTNEAEGAPELTIRPGLKRLFGK